MKDIENETNKNFSSDKERILRKTFEIIERPLDVSAATQKAFTTEAKTYRIRRGHTIVIRRCQDIMRHLWQMGFKHNAILRKEPIENAIFYCAGGDYRTIKKYVGFDICIQKANAIDPARYKAVPGYLERLHYLDKIGSGKFQLNHTAVPLKYHYSESLFSGATLPQNSESASVKEVLCVSSGGLESDGFFGGKEPTGLDKTNKNKTQHTQIGDE